MSKAKAEETAKALIIVESPAKTRTLRNFLGDEFRVEASMGHVRDLPEKDFGVDVQDGFTPTYITLPERQDVLKKLKEAAEQASEVYLASDPDREGEAIAWHLKEALNLHQARRIEFNEITRQAVQQALQHPRDIDMNRVHAQQARRILDRIVGYRLSPLLWKKASRNTLSAGRVQSVAVRLVVEREREIEAFVPEEYWTITARLTPDTEANAFDATLRLCDGEKLELRNEQEANAVVQELQGAQYVVQKIKRSERKRNPSPPFITSTLQQEAARKLGFSAKRTMQIAQQLYEGVELGAQGSVGLITYMRTDSTRVAAEAQAQARDYIGKEFGERYLPEKPPQYRSRGGAQDAHEAIRPTVVVRTPESVKPYLSKEQYELYRLIWQRFIASQMASAVLDVVTVDIQAGRYTFRATGSSVKFDGFMRVYVEGKDNGELSDEERPPLPPMMEGQVLTLLDLLPEQHFTEPPPRYTEATLVKALEEKGIGRPSTYATILSTIVERGYVELRDKKFYPTQLGVAVTDYLVKHFPDILDVQFTASVEQQLDEIEEGKQEWREVLRAFYEPFAQRLAETERSSEFVRIEPKETDYTCPTCGAKMLLREGRYGKFLGCSRYPECKTVVKVTPSGEPVPPDRPSDETCDQCGSPMVIRWGRYGDYLACSNETCGARKPLEKSLGVTCPACKQGQIVERRARRGKLRGKVFYGCNRYPDCDFTLWDKPVGRMCPSVGRCWWKRRADAKAWSSPARTRNAATARKRKRKRRSRGNRKEIENIPPD
ncbi:MAG: type I DNA topoisomerase [Armatimonadetes bacterium]|nr:type I DNA topoisomerase [Armatimonadota bacterium]